MSRVCPDARQLQRPKRARLHGQTGQEVTRQSVIQATGNQLVSFAIFGKACKEYFIAICMTTGLFCYIWRSLQSRICRYLRGSRPLLPYLAKLAKHILSFAMFGKACKAELLAFLLQRIIGPADWQMLGLQKVN